MTIRKIALAGTAMLVLSAFNAGAALADSDEMNWTGVYAGGNLGGTVGHANVDIPNYPSQFNISEGSFSLGGQVGANWQVNRWLLLGVEGDGDWMNEYGSHLSDASSSSTEKFATRFDWRYSARVQIGQYERLQSWRRH